MSNLIIVSVLLIVATICVNYSMASVIVHPKVPTDLLDKSKEMTREITCKLPVKRGHCRALFPRWRYDSETKKCYEFGFGGCDGNGNNFLSEKDCMKYCEGV